MGASLYYQPLNGKLLNVGAPSGFMQKLREALNQTGNYGELRLMDYHVHILQGLRAGLDSLDQKEALSELIDAVKAGEIRLWEEY